MVDGGVHSLEKEIKDMNENVTNVRLDIRELTTEIRNIKEMQAMVIDHNTGIYANKGNITAAHKRIDKIDKIVYGVVAAFIVSWLGLVIWIAQRTGEQLPVPPL